MQRTVRVNDSQLVMLAERARTDHSLAGYLRKKAGELNKWQLRWFLLYQNMLFYYETEAAVRPAGVVLLEGSYCERLITPSNIITTLSKGKDNGDKLYCFAITYRCENQRQYELGACNEAECNMWIDAIREASFNKLLLQKEELEQKHLHLLQVVESERTAKWHYTHQCEELSSEIKKLRLEMSGLKKERRPLASYGYNTSFSTGSLNLVGGGSVEEDDSAAPPTQEALELRKIKKVQSFFRGWLCRRRWKQIVEQYIKSPHAESMRKRNSLVFRMVEAEEEYMEQMEVLVSCYLRPLRMAASSKKPPCSHEDLNSIFLNSETVLFLHQIFLKGLTTRMENWPTLVLGDLFDILLPMLSIYQEYVRNHHYSLQVLTECKQNALFVALLARLEHKPACQGRSLETFLTYPMHQVPRYIITLHELLAHTPHNHVERKSLQNARQQLENLSRQMHDEVSETENLRKNLSVERMISEGCDILLDVNQVFVRQGNLVQILSDRPRTQRSRLTSFSKSSDKEAFRQCYLFSNHLIMTTRSTAGRLNLVPDIGKIPLVDAFLIEDPSEASENEGTTLDACGSMGPYQGRDFKVVADVRSGASVQQVSLHFVAPTVHEKTAWISDIGQCIENVHFSNLLHVSSSDTSSVTMPKFIRNDPKLFNDDIDIRFGPGLNSCKVPHIRSATPERLLERLTDLRFLSIDFLNTFLLTYRVFTDSIAVLEALKKVFYNADLPEAATAIARGSIMSLDAGTSRDDHTALHLFNMERRRSSASPRRTSGASSVSGYGSEVSDRDRSHSYDSQGFSKYHWRCSFRKYEQEERELALINEGPNIICQSPSQVSDGSGTGQGTGQGAGQGATTVPRKSVTIHVEAEDDDEDMMCHLTIPSTTDIAASSSADTLTDAINIGALSSPSNLSSVTLVGSNHSDLSPQDLRYQKIETSKSESQIKQEPVEQQKMAVPAQSSPQEGEKRRGRRKSSMEPLIEMSLKEGKEEEEDKISVRVSSEKEGTEGESAAKDGAAGSADEGGDKPPGEPRGRSYSKSLFEVFGAKYGDSVQSNDSEGTAASEAKSGTRSSRVSVTANHITSSVIQFFQSYYASRRSIYETDFEERSVSQRPSLQLDLPANSSKAGVVVTSHRTANRSTGNEAIWSSTSSAAAAFAIATSACSNPPDQSPHKPPLVSEPSVGGGGSSTGTAPSRRTSGSTCGRNSTVSANLLRATCRDRGIRKESIMSSAATMRVINVLRHWVSKHVQDFEKDPKLKTMTIEFLDEIIYCPNLLPAEHKAATQLMRFITKEVPDVPKTDFVKLLTPSAMPSLDDNIETLSALELAEQMIYIDHKIFVAIGSEEFLGQAWMKADKATRAPHILILTKRFNDMSQLVLSEILRRNSISNRVAVIEKWAAVADISRCLHNYNGVLQICSAFMNSSVYRLKKTWERVAKTTKQSLEKLQAISSPDGRFRVLRDALYRCDPPCIPYLGMYLSDLSFIEEGTPTFTDDKLLNFSKMKMIAHVIRDIRHFQQTPYKIVPITKVSNYLLDTSLLLDEDVLYGMSLEIEPRTSRLAQAALFHSTSLGS